MEFCDMPSNLVLLYAFQICKHFWPFCVFWYRKTSNRRPCSNKRPAPVLTPKVTNFWTIFEEFWASIKRPQWLLRRKRILPDNYDMLNHRMNKSFFLLVQIRGESKGLLALHPIQKFSGFPDLLREYFVLPYWQCKHTVSIYFSFLFVNIDKQ